MELVKLTVSLHSLQVSVSVTDSQSLQLFLTEKPLRELQNINHEDNRSRISEQFTKYNVESVAHLRSSTCTEEMDLP